MSRRTLRIIVGVLVAAALLYAPYYFEAPMNQNLSRAIYFAVAAMVEPAAPRARPEASVNSSRPISRPPC